ncbi:hypothetical protein JR316_0011980 [Psilocybe cubensis]|uniref:Uncharacterized protein n=1 Tax=Psilocybe cubensis TaxID=181762 RepID=A0ACB8GN03_PSICU|nr:hypothetical protein JR316_0011980 [Psilocybe cubensis]KAH9476405.1 hypothetical protein JR316_0011980 [Psilocybe cubensis]
MTPVARSLPFLHLNEDILFYIFSLNANSADSFIPGRPRLVCHKWRRLILSSPTLWANSLDLELLAGGNDNWRNEVVKRTDKECMRDFLEVFLDENWARIRRLLINDYFYDAADWEELLQRPAPNLEQLCIQGDVPFEDMDDGILFSGTSPRALREVQLRFRLTVDPAHPWYNNLRHFHDLCVDKFTASQFLRGLKLLPHLETLGITNTFFHYEVDQSLIPVQIPNLSRLSITESNVMTIILLLKYIVPGPHCSLIFNDWDESRDLSSDIVTNFLDIGAALSTFLRHQSYQHRTFPNFHYYEMSDHGHFNIHDGRQFLDITLEDIKTILSNNGNNWPGFVAQVNAALLSGLVDPISTTTKLHLAVHQLPSPSDSMLSFLNHFKNVNTLETDAKTLQIIREAEQIHQEGNLGSLNLFPSVCNIVVHDWQRYEPLDSQEIYQFVRSRKDHAMPIKKVSFESRDISIMSVEEAASWRALASELDFEVEFESGAIHDDLANISDSDI